MNAIELKKLTKNILEQQGYKVQNNRFCLPDNNRDTKREIHCFSRAERIYEHINFIEKFLPKVNMLDSKDINIKKISPELIELKASTFDNDLFKWWNLVWWSLPYEGSYGRQMRFMVWDKFHKAPIGLINLQSPILSWNVRDKYLDIKRDEKDFWVNQSMNAQRLGALPPYNKILGGKLVALLMTSSFIKKAFEKKYENYKTLILERKIPANLLFITTTGAYGKSSIYNRLKFANHPVCKFIGYTHGSGSFHIPNSLYELFVSYLKRKKIKVNRGFGNGPSVKNETYF